MDDSRVVPRGSHFCCPESHSGNPGIFKWENRYSVGPVSYYYINFGLSMRFPKANTALTTRTEDLSNDPRVFADGTYNPFKADIFQLGLTMANVIKEYPALRAFSPVADRMMSTNPAKRPEPAKSLEEFNTIVTRILAIKSRAPIMCKYGAVTYFAKTVMRVFHKNYPPTRRYENLRGIMD